MILVGVEAQDYSMGAVDKFLLYREVGQKQDICVRLKLKGWVGAERSKEIFGLLNG